MRHSDLIAFSANCLFGWTSVSRPVFYLPASTTVVVRLYSSTSPPISGISVGVAVVLTMGVLTPLWLPVPDLVNTPVVCRMQLPSVLPHNFFLSDCLFSFLEGKVGLHLKSL